MSNQPIRFFFPGIQLAFLFFIVSAVSVAGEEDQPVSLPDGGYAVPLTGDHVRQYIDPDAVLSATEVWEQEFWQSADDKLSYGYTDSAVWLRFRVVGPGSGNVWLTEHHGIDRIEVWELTSTGIKFVGGSGWMNPEAASSRQASRNVSTVALPSSLERTYLLRLVSTSSMSPRIVLMGDDAFWRSSIFTGIVQGFSLALTLIFLIFGLAILTVHPGRVIGSFVCLVLTAGLVALYTTGMGPLILWDSLPVFTGITSRAAVPLFLIAGILFLLAQFNGGIPLWFSRGLKVLLGYTIILSFLIALVPVSISFQIQNILFMTVVIGLEALFLVAFLLRIANTGYILMASTVMVIAASVHLLLNLGIMDGVPGVYSYGFVSVIGMLLQNTIYAAFLVISTENQRLEEQLARRQAEISLEAQHEQILQANRMTGLAKRVSVVSHEVVTPLGGTRLLGTGAISKVGEIRDDYRNEKMTREDFEGFLDYVDETGRLIDGSLKQAIGIMEGFRVIAAEEATLGSRVINIRAFLEDFRKITEPLVRRGSHSLKVEEPECRDSIRTIPGYLSQILGNLIGNSLRHAFPDGMKGTIRLSVYEGTGNELMFDVRDDGGGVSSDLRERIFDMHFTTAGETGGTGLGLAVSRSLAEDKLNGRLEYQTPDEGGSLFRLVLNELKDEAAP